MSDKKQQPEEQITAVETTTDTSNKTVKEPVKTEEELSAVSEQHSSANNTDTAKTKPKVKAKTKKAETKPQPVLPETTKSTAKTAASWPGYLALLLSLVALAAVGYLYWNSAQQNKTAATSTTELESKIDSLSTQVKDALNSLNNNSSSLKQTAAGINQRMEQLQGQSKIEQNNIAELQTRLTRSIQQVSAQQKTNRKDWLLAEVEYLLRLANQRVLMEQTATGALQLLKSADKILKETDDVSIYEVRKSLANDIAALEAVPKLDIEGVFLKLNALNLQVRNLRVIPISEQYQLPELLEEVTPEVITESWSAELKASWSKAVDKLGSLIIIKHHDQPIEPLMSPDQAYYLQQNLHLMLEQAQLSLLQHKQASYDSSLEKAYNWIDTYFEKKDSVTQSLLQNISELKDVKVITKMPDISGSLRALKDYLSHMRTLRQEAAQ